ncbi:PREDICTED: COMM domain-containing protein 4 isoform X2 [Trachymyrmex cornetzi]|uniref:COMM domain-containing protein 4 isoform X2 n=1 Tax=Trachymyrmex cornetzi TaxID=471704 RepID=UPI00084F79B1|nr:PREDICTED: COMM domain-containing protein 4 isoform X2 [Trachymyrmex cornetzi]
MAVGRLLSGYLCPLVETPEGHPSRGRRIRRIAWGIRSPDAGIPTWKIPLLFEIRFRFLGDGDCPDWLLAEINTLSRMTSIKMKMLGQAVAKYLTEGELDEEKIKKITQDAKLDVSDAKAMVAALELIFTSSVRYGVSAADLSSELQQLGLPREHSTAVARLHTDHCPQIMAVLSSQSLRVSRLSSIEVLPCDSSSPVSAVTLKLKKIDGKEEDSTINISKDNVQVLLKELKRARALMENL